MRFRVLANLPHAIAALGLLSVLNVLAFAQQQPQLRSVTYRLSMSLPMSHLFEVKIEVELPDGANQSLDFQMPRWSPGRYAVFDFAKNVQEVWAASGICPTQPGQGTHTTVCRQAPLPVTRIDNQTWRVENKRELSTDL